MCHFLNKKNKIALGKNELQTQLNDFSKVDFNKLKVYLKQLKVNVEKCENHMIIFRLFEYYLNKLR